MTLSSPNQRIQSNSGLRYLIDKIGGQVSFSRFRHVLIERMWSNLASAPTFGCLDI